MIAHDREVKLDTSNEVSTKEQTSCTLDGDGDDDSVNEHARALAHTRDCHFVSTRHANMKMNVSKACLL